MVSDKIYVNQNKIIPFKIKRQAKNVFESDVEKIVICGAMYTIQISGQALLA